jgi:HPt (histidine-containing phosphotransfer) domain-containing protein
MQGRGGFPAAGIATRKGSAMMQATARQLDGTAQAAERAGTPDAPVDLVHLARHTLGNRELEREVLRLFSRQARMMTERMREACEGEALERCLHTLLGSARGIGAWKVAEAVEQAQQALRETGSADLVAVSAAVAESADFIEILLDA